MHRLIATVESYPDLRSSDQMIRLQAQLEGTENRINIARIQFNEAVADFNASTKKFPGNLVASFGGFKRKAYFKAETGSNKVIDLNF
jgi:LemA protein